MARGRMLNKTVSMSVKFNGLPDDTCRLLATWTIAQLDFRGVFYGDPVTVRALIFPMREDITTAQIHSYLVAMHDIGLIQLFMADGRMWQLWPGFADNQTGLRVERERSEFPIPPNDACDLPESFRHVAANLPPKSLQKFNLNLKSKSKRRGAALVAPPPPTCPPDAVTQTDAVADAIKATDTTPAITDFEAEAKATTPDLETHEPVTQVRPRDELFDAIAEVTLSNVKLLGSRIGKTTAELRKIGATPDLVRKVSRWYTQNDWRGRKGERLTFEVLKEVWDQGCRGVPVVAVSSRTRRQVGEYTEAEREASRQRARERIEERAARNGHGSV